MKPNDKMTLDEAIYWLEINLLDDDYTDSEAAAALRCILERNAELEAALSGANAAIEKAKEYLGRIL